MTDKLMTPLQRAAGAAHEALCRAHVSAYLDMPDDTAEVVVRAVLLAIREPSEAMVEAANIADRGMMPWAQQYQAMIDAALSEKICDGIYLHYGMCPHIPADTPAGRERDRKLAEREAAPTPPRQPKP